MRNFVYHAVAQNMKTLSILIVNRICKHMASKKVAKITISDVARVAGVSVTIVSCARAVQVFLSILGNVAGDLALAQGARAVPGLQVALSQKSLS